MLSKIWPGLTANPQTTKLPAKSELIGGSETKSLNGRTGSDICFYIRALLLNKSRAFFGKETMASSATQSLGPDAQRSRQLEFGKAMSDFKSMFPSIDYDVIEMVLRANNGLVDATVDQLLIMQTQQNETNNTLVDPELNVRLPGYNDSSINTANEPPPAYTPRVEDDPNFSYDKTYLEPQTPNIDTSFHTYDTPFHTYDTPFHTYDTTASFKTNGWNPPLVGALPNDFLRLSVHEGPNGRPTTTTSSSHRGDTSSSSRHDMASRGMKAKPATTTNRDKNPSIPPLASDFSAIPDSETRNTSSGSKQQKSKRFGHMSRKFKRKKSKTAKNNYQPMSSANLIDDDEEQEKGSQR